MWCLGRSERWFWFKASPQWGKREGAALTSHSVLPALRSPSAGQSHGSPWHILPARGPSGFLTRGHSRPLNWSYSLGSLAFPWVHGCVPGRWEWEEFSPMALCPVPSPDLGRWRGWWVSLPSLVRPQDLVGVLRAGWTEQWVSACLVSSILCFQTFKMDRWIGA